MGSGAGVGFEPPLPSSSCDQGKLLHVYTTVSVKGVTSPLTGRVVVGI